MASKDRILRLKEDTRSSILKASLDIAREEGWSALSMRKIADRIEYTAPIIYEYFGNKEAILMELTRMGFVRLAAAMEKAKNQFKDPAKQLEAMWLAYWNFAFEEKETYQVMYGVGVGCCTNDTPCNDIKKPALMFVEKIKELVPKDKCSKEYIERRYYTFWSVVHGLISINMTRKLTSDEVNKQVLKDAIGGIINAIKS